MSIAKEVATAIVKSNFWPNVDPNAVLTLCYLAEAEGHHPAVVYRDYHIMQGKPSKKAEAILRDFAAAGGKVKWHQLDDECADATFSHPSGEARITWDMARARQANLNTAMWKKYPRQMLRSRVVSEGVRTVYPGATSGLYEQNEVADILAEEMPANVSEPADEGQGQGTSQGAVSPPSAKPKNWGGRYPTATALKNAMHEHHAELRRLGDEGSQDDLDAYLASPEYGDYIAQASEHRPFYLEGDLPDSAPPEFTQTFALEQRARDMIALRGGRAAEPIEEKETTNA